MFRQLEKDYLNALQNFLKNLQINFPEINEEQINNILITNLRDQNYKYIKDIKMSTSSTSNGCKHIMKTGIRKDEECGAKPMKDSHFCSKHKNSNVSPALRLSPIEKEAEEKIDLSRIYIRPNQHRNFVYGDTGYIIKSASEKYVVAKEGPNGEWLPLTEEDKHIIKRKYKLRYKIIDFTKNIEKTNKDIIASVELFKEQEEEPMMAKINRMMPFINETLEE